MDLLNFKNIAIFAVLGGIASAWSQVRGWIRNVFFFFVRSDVIYSRQVFTCVAALVLKESSRISIGSRYYFDTFKFVNKLKDTFWLCCRGFKNKELVLYHKWIPVVIDCKNNSFNYLIFTFDLEKIIRARERKTIYSQKNGVRFYVSKKFAPKEPYRNSPVETSSSKSVAETPFPQSQSNLNDVISDNLYPIDFISFKWDELGAPADQAQREFYPNKDILVLEKEISKWKNDKEWFLDRGVPRRRSYALVGPPGTGKSSAIKYLGKKFDLPIITFDLSGFNNQDFTNEFSSVEPDTIILFEDIDACFEQRVNLNKNDLKDRLTFDHFINTLSGIETFSNHILFITTNHLEKLDPALLRPGRIDRIIEIGSADEDCRRFIAKKILKDWPDLCEETILKTEGKTAAEVENVCIDLALKKVWQKI